MSVLDTRDRKTKDRDAYLTEILCGIYRGVYFAEEQSNWKDELRVVHQGCEPQQGMSFCGEWLSPSGENISDGRDAKTGRSKTGGIFGSWMPSLDIEQAMYLLTAMVGRGAVVSVLGSKKSWSVAVIYESEVLDRTAKKYADVPEAICALLHEFLVRTGEWIDPTWRPETRVYKLGERRELRKQLGWTL